MTNLLSETRIITAAYDFISETITGGHQKTITINDIYRTLHIPKTRQTSQIIGMTLQNAGFELITPSTQRGKIRRYRLNDTPRKAVV